MLCDFAMKSERPWIIIGGWLLALAQVCYAQKVSNWRAYKVADGLPESSCISVTVSPQGKVVARHLMAPKVSQLDGYSLSTISAPETGKGRIYLSPGGQLWTVAPEGLAEFRDGTWVTHRMPELTDAPHSGPVLDPVPLCPVKQGLVLLLLPERLLEFSSERLEQPHSLVLREAPQTALQRFMGLVPARNGGLWITGSRGLARAGGPLRAIGPET